jgi:hypothetical protein
LLPPAQAYSPGSRRSHTRSGTFRSEAGQKHALAILSAAQRALLAGFGLFSWRSRAPLVSVWGTGWLLPEIVPCHASAWHAIHEVSTSVSLSYAPSFCRDFPRGIQGFAATRFISPGSAMKRLPHHDAFASIAIFLAGAALGNFNSSTPSFSVASALLASTAAGSETTRSNWSEHCSS